MTNEEKEIKETQDQHDNVAELENETNKVLYRAKAFFPFQLFPDTITVDHNKIDIVYRRFFWNKHVFTILHEDLTTIKITTGFLFASASFEVKGYEQNPDPVNNLKIGDAVRLHEIVIGINKLTKKEIDTEKLPVEATSESAGEIGRVNEDLVSPM